MSETSSDGRGISERIGKAWTTNGDVPVDRLMWQAVCVIGKKLAGSSSNNNNNKTCLPVITNIKNSFIHPAKNELNTISYVEFNKDNLFLNSNCLKMSKLKVQN